jgi:GNAT superfamily N-acetyltransferase
MEPLLESFDREMRREAADLPGMRVEREPRVVRCFEDGGHFWSGVLWSRLDEDGAAAAIAREVEIFGDRTFEWKYYDYDTPAHLETLLIDAGFERGEDESVMVAPIDRVPRTPPPSGIEIVEAHDAAGVERLLAVHEAVFGTDASHYGAYLLWLLENAPGSQVLLLALDRKNGDLPVCAARVELTEGARFAGLWGGGTLPEYRGRGIYRALVSYRADLAAKRGHQYLHVDASADSRPILERLGFERLARTTPYVHSPK